MGRPGTEHINPDVRFRRLINDAVAKDPANPLALFLDTNISPERANRFYDPQSTIPLQPSRAMTSVLDQTRKEYGGVDPYNILVFSNHPQHYSRPGSCRS